jgi:hypothetical protein
MSHAFPDELITLAERLVQSASYGMRTGRHVEARTGALNISVIGRNASMLQRRDYLRHDRQTGERDSIIAEIEKQFPEYEANRGGQISIDIAPRGWNKGRIVREGGKVALLCLGTRLAECAKAAETLAGRGLATTIADMRFLKPLDLDLVLRLSREHEVLLTVEEGSMGGFGAAVLHALAHAGALDRGLKIRTLTLPDRLIDHDTQERQYAQAGLDAAAIANAALAALGVASDSAQRA